MPGIFREGVINSSRVRVGFGVFRYYPVMIVESSLATITFNLTYDAVVPSGARYILICCYASKTVGSPLARHQCSIRASSLVDSDNEVVAWSSGYIRNAITDATQSKVGIIQLDDNLQFQITGRAQRGSHRIYCKQLGYYEGRFYQTSP